MASINSAIAFFQMNNISLPEDASGVSEVTVLALAKKFEEWVYRKDES
jgi:hypothetical protein